MPMAEKDVKHLKTMMGIAKSQPVNIALCLGLKPSGIVIRVDKVKSAENLGRDAKSAGETTKVCLGILTVEGTTACFKCVDKPPSGTKAQLKAYFKLIKLSTAFKFTDANGKEFAADDDEGAEGQDVDGVADDGLSDEDASEDDPAGNPLRDQWQAAWAMAEPRVAKALQKDGPEAGKIRAVRDFALGKAEADQFEAALKSLGTLMGVLETVAKTTAPKEGSIAPNPQTADRGDLLARLGKVKPRIAVVKGPLEQKLAEMFQKAVDLVQAGSLDIAADLLGKIEVALGRVEATRTEAVEIPDPKLAKIISAEAQLRKQVGAEVGGDPAKAMLVILDRVVDALNMGEAETALSGLKRVQDGLKLQAEVDRLSPLVARAASSGQVEDVNALTLLFSSVAGQIPAADHGKAIALLSRVEQMIAAGKNLKKTAFEQDQPLEIRPYAEARVNWNLTRGKLRTEIVRLQDSINKALADEGIDDDMPEVDALFGYIEKLDQRLEVKLGEIVNSDAGDTREKLKIEARSLIAEYNNELNSDFFKDVDDNNGFVQLAVASTARNVLNDLSKVLAA